MVEEKKKSHKVMIIIAIAVLVVAILMIFLFGRNIFFSPSGITETWVPIDLTPDNLPSYLSKFKPVSDVPEDGKISLAIGEENYVITKGNVEKGTADNSDIKLKLPKNYFLVIGEIGWCAAMQKAKSDGNLEIELVDSSASFAWKYKKLAKYSSCIS